jgi:hypothetical protein
MASIAESFRSTRAVLSAGHLNAAHSVALQRHHTKSKGRRATDLCSVPSFSLENGPITRWRKSILFGTPLVLAGHAMNLNWFCSWKVRYPIAPGKFRVSATRKLNLEATVQTGLWEVWRTALDLDD